MNNSPYWKNDPYSKHANIPIKGISWFEAYAYAKWAGKRLPSSAEWEKAACGTSNKNGNLDGVGAGNKYPWGNNFFQGQTPPDYKLCNWRLRHYAYRYPDTNGRSQESGYSRKAWKNDGYREEAAPVQSFNPDGIVPTVWLIWQVMFGNGPAAGILKMKIT